MLVSDLVFRAAPDRVALRAENREPLPYSSLGEIIASTRAFLNAHGLDSASSIALVLPNGPTAASAFLAISAASAVAPLNPALTEAEIEFCLRDLPAHALVTIRECTTARAVARQVGIDTFLLEEDPARPAGSFSLHREGCEAVRARDRRPAPDDVALSLHTSGTTSRPKLVALTHESLCASAHNIAASLTLSPADCCLNIMPLFHVHGLVAAVMASLAAGASVYCSPGFNAHRFFSWLSDSNATWYTAVPTMHQAVLGRARVNQAALASHGLRFVRSCSAPLPGPVRQTLEGVFSVPVVSAYGMTEAAHQISCTPLACQESKRGTVGRATGVEIAILDDAGEIAPPGCPGEVIIRGGSVIHSYAGNPDANARSFWSGWLRTGDQGILDGDGYLTLTGRLKEMINVGGEKVAPLEVDAVLMEHPSVSQAVTFGLPDSLLGERVAAVVVLRPECHATAESLRAFAAERLVKFKIPRTVVLRDAIPTGPTGKFQRTQLAAQLGLV